MVFSLHLGSVSYIFLNSPSAYVLYFLVEAE